MWAVRRPEGMVPSSCYMCSLAPTSREHAPPRCFFPEPGSFGKDLRKNLITVPSCDLHNSEKCKDDEFLRAVVLLASAENSTAAQHQFFQKLLSAAKRMPHVHKAFLEAREPVRGGSGRVLQFDRKRLNVCLDRLVRALYFHEFGRSWPLPILIVSPNIFGTVEDDAPVPHQPTAKVVEVTRSYLAPAPIRGENPEVFRYRLRTEGEASAMACAVQFYELFEVFAYSSQNLPQGVA